MKEPARRAYRAGGPGLEQIAEQRAQLELLRALPVRQRTVLLLQAAGFSYEETAAKPRHVPANGRASDHASSPESCGRPPMPSGRESPGGG